MVSRYLQYSLKNGLIVPVMLRPAIVIRVYSSSLWLNILWTTEQKAFSHIDILSIEYRRLARTMLLWVFDSGSQPLEDSLYARWRSLSKLEVNGSVLDIHQSLSLWAKAKMPLFWISVYIDLVLRQLPISSAVLSAIPRARFREAQICVLSARDNSKQQMYVTDLCKHCEAPSLLKRGIAHWSFLIVSAMAAKEPSTSLTQLTTSSRIPFSQRYFRQEYSRVKGVSQMQHKTLSILWKPIASKVCAMPKTAKQWNWMKSDVNTFGSLGGIDLPDVNRNGSLSISQLILKRQ